MAAKAAKSKSNKCSEKVVAKNDRMSANIRGALKQLLDIAVGRLSVDLWAV